MALTRCVANSVVPSRWRAPPDRTAPSSLSFPPHTQAATEEAGMGAGRHVARRNRPAGMGLVPCGASRGGLGRTCRSMMCELFLRRAVACRVLWRSRILKNPFYASIVAACSSLCGHTNIQSCWLARRVTLAAYSVLLATPHVCVPGFRPSLKKPFAPLSDDAAQQRW